MKEGLLQRDLEESEKGELKKPWRYWLGTYQISTEHIIHKCPFLLLVCEIAQKCGKYDLHFQVHAVMVLQEAVEYYLTSFMEDANLCTIHMKCLTIMPKDSQLVHHICGEHLHY